jgi:hypothetical protein
MSQKPASWRNNPLLRFLSSVWFGVVLLLLILLYASVVSALPQVRGALEMSEMQVFSHWLFGTLCALFCLSLVLATLLRSPWNLVSAGGIITHVGLLLLVGGAAWYFGSKVEGDVLLFSPRIEIVETKDGVPRTVDSFLAAPDQVWEGLTSTGQKAARIRVVEAHGAGLSPVTDVKLEAQVGDGPPKEISLSTTRRAEAPGGMSFQLRTFPPTSRFYDHELPALYYRNLNAPQSGQHYAGLPQLPWHRERYLDAGYLVHDVNGSDVPSKRTNPYLAIGGLHIPTGWFEHWRLPIHANTPETPFDVEITGYLPYTSETGYDAYTQDGRRLDEKEQRSTDLTHAQIVPRVEPLELRRPGLGRGPSVIRLKFTGKGAAAGWSELHWCPFSQYPDVDATPVRVHPPNVSETWEFVYSRYPHDLGAKLAGESLSVKFFPGRQSAESWRSDLLVQPSGAATAVPAAVYTNQTYTVGPYTLFQSGAATDHWSWTVLGVGNSRGIWPMTVGCLLIVLGTLYAFYAKPLILRRRLARRGFNPPLQREVSHELSASTSEVPV